MSEQGLICRSGEGQALNIFGAAMRFLCRAEDTNNAWSAMENILPKDTGPPLHTHPWDEAFYIVEGQLEFQVGDWRSKVGPGDFIYTPAGVPHAFRGTSDEPARMIIFDAPAFLEGYFKEVDREVTVLPRDFAKVPEIAGRYGMTQVGPPLTD